MNLDRRTIKDRRIVTRAKAASEMADSIVLVIVPPEGRAAQVERIYECVPQDKRAEIGLTYAHVRAVLDALRDNCQ